MLGTVKYFMYFSTFEQNINLGWRLSVFFLPPVLAVEDMEMVSAVCGCGGAPTLRIFNKGSLECKKNEFGKAHEI